MLKLIDTTGHLFTPAAAEAKAGELQAGDPEWTYVVVHDPAGTGYSYIEIRDESGEAVGRL